MNINSNALAEKLQSRDATREPTWVRYTLITIALLFFLSCLILPLILVFVEAFKQGVGVYAHKPWFIQTRSPQSNSLY